MKAGTLIVIAGPTATGKTSLAIELAGQLQTEIINADSRQVYREMRIGTAVPTDEQMQRVPHHLIRHRSIHEHYNASIYEQEALEILDQLFLKHENVVMTGGSGLYIDAVCKGIDDLPAVDPTTRKAIRKVFHEEGLAGIRSRLQGIDPDYYQRVDLNNPQRILKALEVSAMSGKPYSSFLTGKSKVRGFQVMQIGLDIPRHELHDRINKRADSMMKDGLLEEYFDGNASLDEAVEKIKGHTRQYARRQLTWFRRNKDMQWFSPDKPAQILRYVDQKLLTHGRSGNKTF
jgi:tRNA dimethylallyltransferase